MLLRELLIVVLQSLYLFQSASTQTVPKKDHSKNQYFAVESDLSIEQLKNLHPDWNFEHNVRGLENHYVFSKKYVSNNNSIRKRDNFEDLVDNTNGILSFQDLPPHKLFKRGVIPRAPIDSGMQKIFDFEKELNIHDPLFHEQWHLINPSFPGNDVNMTDVWRGNITGKNVTVAIVDDGVDYENEDLKDKFCFEGSWDFNDNTAKPKPRLSDDYHGTRCAGEIAAVRNDYCGVGVAFDAHISGLRILSGELTVEDEAAALIYGLKYNDIFSCSWGPPDDGQHLQGPYDLVKKAFIKGIQDGRDEKGAIYVFASGNGAISGDNCNYDGYTNSIYSITIGAIDHRGLHPAYSESCSAVMAVTYSSGSGKFIETTDINGKCSTHHGGTSAAAPLAAGVYALLLEANPELTWRDVQYLTILSSKTLDENTDGKWQEGALGKRYSHMYGYGNLDAYELIELGKTWENVNPQDWYFSKVRQVDSTTNSTDDILESTIRVSEQGLKNANVKRIEHIQIIVDIDSSIRGQTTIDLISPTGMVSNLGVIRKHDLANSGFKDWTFMSVAHWGEDGIGDWKLQVRTHDASNKITFNNWRLKFYGESIDPTKVQKFVYGQDKVVDEKPNNDEDNSSIASSNAPQDTSTTINPSHTSSEESKPSSIVSNIPEPTSSSIPNKSNIDNQNSDKAEGYDDDVETPNKLSSKQKWFNYFVSLFAVGVVIFILYIMFFTKTRRKIKRSRAETYEFDIIDTDSDYDSTLDNALITAEGLNEPLDIDDLEFDLSDEDRLGSTDINGNKVLENIDSVLTDPFVDPLPTVQEEDENNNGHENLALDDDPTDDITIAVTENDKLDN
ncbi:hypothetical protein TBLA_0B00130 [Henningerozyma blattae CBS 6284]|uniref:P/Homo B domain-containing protein n=1 Tax=Henningerozyma blattae (strain ATCC 34711 / CBS 6284 / DSM 70876 / NBRC 10599 / NRRL Y-10934 / UCD 77-7) TaxID=1071380 RepID=I2GXK6_HENB6|nr:hypothetical protein TBLA_0B00130 [Tetrapisispora blattae CBS 6284]CCH58858.1 hypothetical protein TBLA_0B00130 [Tetrapisispora blattae CBS 6284]